MGNCRKVKYSAKQSYKSWVKNQRKSSTLFASTTSNKSATIATVGRRQYPISIGCRGQRTSRCKTYALSRGHCRSFPDKQPIDSLTKSKCKCYLYETIRIKESSRWPSSYLVFRSSVPLWAADTQQHNKVGQYLSGESSSTSFKKAVSC